MFGKYHTKSFQSLEKKAPDFPMVGKPGGNRSYTTYWTYIYGCRPCRRPAAFFFGPFAVCWANR